MKVVILGCGRTGANLARMLVAESHQVAVIDKERSAFTRLGPDFAGTAVIGVGIDEDVLRQAGIEEADAFVAVTNGDNTNAMAAQVARDIFGVPQVVCRIYDPLRAEIYYKLGLQVICPTLWGATWIKEVLES
jgi:trk system potassium uptake protein TrkA